MIKAENITKSYKTLQGENTILDNLSFSAKSGEFCIITGESGCGKSTLLNVLSSLDSFDSGNLVINHTAVLHSHSRDIYNIRKKDIAFIFQGYNLISSLTAIENVALSLKYQGIVRAERIKKSMVALDEVGLSHRTDYLPHQMSGGQQQRVAIARALVTKPKILFCDEPTGNLDRETALLVLEKINHLKSLGTLVIMITHDRSLLSLADRCLTLIDGKLIE